MQLATVDIACETCGAKLSVAPQLRTTQCPYCDSPAVVDRPATPDRPDPSFVIGFVLDQEAADARVQRWIRSRGLFAHSGLRTASLEKVRGVYLPAYLYGAVAEADYRAEIGEDYTVTETYTTIVNGRTTTRTRRVTKTEWRSLRGDYSRYVVDVLVTASRGIPNAELEAIEPFDLRAMHRYSPAILSGWIAEEPSKTRANCLALAHRESADKIGRELERFMPGDHHRELRHSTHLRDEVIDLILLPVWVFAARYAAGKPPVRILVNGQTGEVQGKVPLSATKITIAVLLGLAVLAAILFAVFGNGARR